MSDSPVYLVVTAIPNLEKLELLKKYSSQVMPLLIKGGGEPIATYSVIEQLEGDGGPKSVSITKFQSAQAIKDVFSTEEFKALADIRAEVTISINQLFCSAL